MKRVIDVQKQTIHWVSDKGEVVRSQAFSFARKILAFLGRGALSAVAGFADRASSGLIMRQRGHDGFKIFSRWDVEHWRGGKLLFAERGVPNLYTTEGITCILNDVFKNTASPDPWYVGIQSTNNPASGWTMANQGSTWSQFTSVDETTWPEAVDGSISGGQITMSQVTFNIAGSGTVYGAHLTSNSTKGATSGTLLCAVNFTASRSVVLGDDLLVTYTVGAQDDGV